MEATCRILLGTAVEHALEGSDGVQAFGLSDGPSRVLGTHQRSSQPSSCIDEAGALRSERVVLSRPSSLLRPPPTPSRLPATSRVTGYRQARSRSPQTGAEEGLSSSHDNLLAVPRPLTPEGPSAPAPRSQAPSMAFADLRQARLPLAPLSRAVLTTLQASLDVADRTVAPPRFDAGLSTDAGGSTTGDLGVSPDRTFTGWLS